MFHVPTIKNWFKGRAEDFNKIAEFLNNLCGDGFIRVTRPDRPSNGAPPTISLDAEKLKSLLGIGADGATSENDKGATDAMSDDFDPQFDTPPIETAGENIWVAMTKDEEASKENEPRYFGYKENAVIAIEKADGAHKLWWTEKFYSPDGRLMRVSRLKGVTLIGA